MIVDDKAKYRNKYFDVALMYTLQTTHLRAINHKFLETGHTDMEGVSIHAAVENAKGNVSVNVADDWLTVAWPEGRNRIW